MPSLVEAQKSTFLTKSVCDSWRGNKIGVNRDAICLISEGAIQQVYVDSTCSIIYVLVRDGKKGKLKRNGNVVAYDFHEDRELWSYPFDFKDDHFFLADTLPIRSGKYYTECLSRHSGDVLWRVERMQTELVTGRGIGLGKNHQFLVGLDLSNGKEIWRKHTSDEIDALEIHDDTAAVFLSGGLNYRNLNTGEGFKVKANTLEKYWMLGGGGVSIAAGVVLGGLIGGAFIAVIVTSANGPSGSADHRSDNSLTDVYMHDKGILFTSKKQFFNVDYNGEIIWSVPIEKAIGPSRKVFAVDDAAFVISKGMINSESGPVYRDAVLYRMNLDGSGSILGVQLNTERREYIQDFIVKDSTVVVALNNKLIEVSLHNLGTIKEQSFGNTTQNAGFGTILNPPAILYKDSRFEMASEKNPDDFFVSNKGGMKIRFSDELTPVEVIRQANYFVLSKKVTAKKMFVTNGTDVYLINTAGEKLSEFSFSPQMQYIGGRVFDYDDNRVVGIKF